MTHELLIHLATWNVANQPPPTINLSLEKLLSLNSPVLPDICVVGLQEAQKSADWASQLAKALAAADYVLVRIIQMHGIILHAYALRKHLPFITNVETQYTRTAFGGLLGTKGGVSIRADLYGVNVIVINCHLCAYDEKFAERIEHYNLIIEGQTFKDKDIENILDHDYVFWIGDLNFRIDNVSREEIMEKIEKKDFGSLMDNDQLCKARKEELLFLDFSEGSINFQPTYKFDLGTDDYDSGPKCRKPAWCDRILWMVHEDAFLELSGMRLASGSAFDPKLEAHLLTYTSLMEYQLSDHKPVVAQFKIKAFDVKAGVIFEDPQGWQCGVEFTVKFQVYGIATSSWDYIALFKADFFNLDEYITYVYATACKSDVAEGCVAKFLASAIRDAGCYRLCYISSGKKFIRGMSGAFEVLPKFASTVPASTPPGDSASLETSPPPSACRDMSLASEPPAAGSEVSEKFDDAEEILEVREEPTRPWLQQGSACVNVSESSTAPSGQVTKSEQLPELPAEVAVAGTTTSGSRIRHGMSIQELKLVSAELREEHQRKQSTASLLLAKASRLSTRLYAASSSKAAGPTIEEEISSLMLPAPATNASLELAVPAGLLSAAVSMAGPSALPVVGQCSSASAKENRKGCLADLSAQRLSAANGRQLSIESQSTSSGSTSDSSNEAMKVVKTVVSKPAAPPHEGSLSPKSHDKACDVPPNILCEVPRLAISSASVDLSVAVQMKASRGPSTVAEDGGCTRNQVSPSQAIPNLLSSTAPAVIAAASSIAVQNAKSAATFTTTLTSGAPAGTSDAQELTPLMHAALNAQPSNADTSADSHHIEKKQE